MFTPEDLQRAEEAGEFDVDANILNLRPDPAHFVGFLKSIDRSDVLSELFVRLLETYREYKTIDDADPMRCIITILNAPSTLTPVAGHCSICSS